MGAQTSQPARRYDKGERRYKHVAKGATPQIKYQSGNPRMWIGKCPSTLTPQDHDRLLNQAIPGRNGDRDLPCPKKLYVVHDGAIYEAQTSDRGKSYHGYPYRGKIGSALLALLRATAAAKGCATEFDSWVKKHIEVHGP